MHYLDSTQFPAPLKQAQIQFQFENWKEADSRAVWLGVKVRKWESEEMIIASFGTWELVSKVSGVWILLASVIWKMLCLFRCLDGNVEVEVKNLTTKLTQNNIKIKIN